LLPHRKHEFSITKTSLLMVFTKIIDVCSEDRTKTHKYTVSIMQSFRVLKGFGRLYVVAIVLY
jgi:hypothetical protein